jgi:hypothetical protein
VHLLVCDTICREMFSSEVVVTVKWVKGPHDTVMGTSWLQLAVEGASARFNADGCVPSSIFSSCQYVSIDRCHGCLNSFHKVFHSRWSVCAVVLMQVSPHEKINQS